MRRAMDIAGVAASAGGREGVLSLLVSTGAFLIAAERAHRRPVRHRGGSGGAKSLKSASP